MESLQLKKAIFYPNEIVLLKKKGNITINIDDIDHITYTKVSLINIIYPFSLGSSPKLLDIRLNKEINNKKIFYLCIKYKDVRKIQKFFQKIIDITIL